MKLTRVLIIAFLACVAVGFWLFRSPADDPVVDGRLASAWTLDLLSPDYRTRGEAQEVLLRLQSRAVPQVRRLLRRRVYPWQQLNGAFAARLPFLAAARLDPGLCRQRGAEMIAQLGPVGRDAIPELIDSLAYPQAVAETERALLRIGDPARPALTRALHFRASAVRAEAARLLRQYLPENGECVGPLVRALRDGDEKVRRQAAGSLGFSRAGDRMVLRGLVDGTKDKVAEVRAACYEALARLHPGDPEVLATMRAGMVDLMPLVRLQAAKGLWELTRDKDAVLPVLCGILPTQEGWQAAYALGSMGSAAGPAVPALIETMKREKVARAFRTPPSSSLALGQIQEPAIPALKQVLHDPEPAARLSAVLAFNLMGRKAKAAVPELLALLHDPETEIRNVTALTLAAAGAEKNLVLPGLEECLRAEDIYMRSTAAALLRELAPERDWAVSAE